LAILQLRRLRGWSIRKTAEHFVVHRNTIRAWIRSAEGKGRPSLLNGAVVWNPATSGYEGDRWLFLNPLRQRNFAENVRNAG
jgi:hypothetical protein